MRWWDLAELAGLELQLFGTDAWSEATWWGELAQRDRRVYLLERVDGEGPVTGYAGIAVGGAEAEVMTVAVAPDEQGRGLGRRLVQAMVDAAASRGATRLVLEVRSDNVAAQRLYSAMGFERIAVRRGYYVGADAWVMRRRPLVAAPATVEP